MLRKWYTNSEQLQILINEAEGTMKPHTSENICGEPLYENSLMSTVGKNSCGEQLYDNSLGVETKMRSVLGMNWDLTEDDLVFNFKDMIEMAEKFEITKRNVLKVSSSFYDPLGLISPITIQAKRILQTLCKEKIRWDAIICSEVLDDWRSFLVLLKEKELVRVQRCVLSPGGEVISTQNK